MATNILVKPIVFCEAVGEMDQFVMEPFSLATFNNFWQSPYFYEMLGIEATAWVKS